MIAKYLINIVKIEMLVHGLIISSMLIALLIAFILGEGSNAFSELTSINILALERMVLIISIIFAFSINNEL